MSDETEEKEAEHEKDSEEAASEEESQEKPDEKPKKKSDSEKDEEAELGDERPLFARTYPRTPEIDALLAAFERGNYARVREDAPSVASRSDDPEVKRAANDLFRRIQPDPVSKTLLAVAALLLVFFVYWYFGHQHEVPK